MISMTYRLMASQKLTNCCVAAIALVTAAYLSTPHSSTIARLAFGAFCLAIHSLAFLRKHHRLDSQQNRLGNDLFPSPSKKNGPPKKWRAQLIEFS
jgi:hypothetical protein